MTVTVSRTSLLQLPLFLVAFFAIWSVRATMLTVIDEQIHSPLYLAIYSNFVKFLIWVVPVAFFVSRYRVVSAVTYLGVSEFPCARTWLVSFAIIASYLTSTVLIEIGAGAKHFSAATVLTLPFSLLLLQFFVSPLLEEILFRGFVLKELLVLLPSFAAVSLDSLLFAVIHLPYWLAHTGPTAAVFLNLGGVFVFSLLAGWLYVRSASIWPSVLAHLFNNMMATMLLVYNA